MDSLICCKMFPEQHCMDDNKIAYDFGIKYKGCVGMTGQDVAELYSLFLPTPTLRSNPIKCWQDIKNRSFLKIRKIKICCI